MNRLPVIPLLAALGGTLLASPAAAQSLDDHYWLEIAGYWPSVDTEVTVSSKTANTVGTTIDLESDLNLDDNKALPAITAGARIGSGLSIIGEFYSVGRKGTKTLQRAVTFDDVTYPVNASVTSEFDTDIYRLSLGYAFLQGERYELGASLGLHATTISMEISGEGSVGNNASQAHSRKEDVLAPLPTIGLFGSAEIVPHLTANGRVDYLSLKIDDYSGRLINAQAGLTYRLFRNVGIGAGYRYVDYRLDFEKERVEGRFRYRFNGPIVFLQIGF